MHLVERLVIKFKVPHDTDVEKWIKKCLTELLRIIEHDLNINPLDKVGLTFSNTNNSKVDFGISFRQLMQYNTTAFYKIRKRSIFNPELLPIHNNLCLAVAIIISICNRYKQI